MSWGKSGDETGEEGRLGRGEEGRRGGGGGGGGGEIMRIKMCVRRMLEVGTHVCVCVCVCARACVYVCLCVEGKKLCKCHFVYWSVVFLGIKLRVCRCLEGDGWVFYQL